MGAPYAVVGPVDAYGVAVPQATAFEPSGEVEGYQTKQAPPLVQGGGSPETGRKDAAMQSREGAGEGEQGDVDEGEQEANTTGPAGESAAKITGAGVLFLGKVGGGGAPLVVPGAQAAGEERGPKEEEQAMGEVEHETPVTHEVSNADECESYQSLSYVEITNTGYSFLLAAGVKRL